LLEIRDHGPYIGEEDYIEKLDSEIRPYINARRTDGDFESFDGLNLHYVIARADEEKAVVTIFHGKGEFFEKLEELVYVFIKNGFSVFFLEQRGFGRSARLTGEIDKIHVESFDDYVRDQWDFFWKVVMKESHSDIRFMYAHSMGGLIGARFLEVHPQCYRAAVLSSPMLSLYYNAPEFLVSGLCGINHLLHRDDRFASGQHGYRPYIHNPNVMASKARFEAMFKLREENPAFQTTGVTYGWIRTSRIMTDDVFMDAEKACVPILICQAIKDDTVDNMAMHGFCGMVPDGMMVQFPESGHEIYAANYEERSLYFDWLLSYYEYNLSKFKR